MMKYKNDVIFLLIIFLGFLCWCLCLNNGEKLAKAYGIVSYRFETQPLNTKKLNEISKWQKKDDKNNAESTAWTQKYGVKIKSDYEIIESDVIYIWGKVNDELKLYTDNSCAISADIAYELWKSSDVLGKTVDINDISYKISAVLNDASDIALVKADKNNNDMKFDALDIKALNKSVSWTEDDFKAENFLNPDVTVNYDRVSSATYKVALIPGWIIAFTMIAKIVLKLYLERKNKYMFAYMMIVLVVWIALSLKLCQFSLKIPESFIPTRWSDFEFWGRASENMKIQLRKLNLMKVYYPDEYFKRTFINIMIDSLTSSVAFIVSLKYMKIQSINKFIAFEIFVSLISFVAILTGMSTGGYADYTIGYWIMIPLYIVFDYSIKNFKFKKGDISYGIDNISKCSQKIFRNHYGS